MVGWVEAEIKVVDGMHVREKGLDACREMPENCPSARRYTDDTRSHRCPGAQLWLWSSRNWLVFQKRPLHGTLREGSGSLSMQPVGKHSMVLHGRSN